MRRPKKITTTDMLSGLSGGAQLALTLNKDLDVSLSIRGKYCVICYDEMDIYNTIDKLNRRLEKELILELRGRIETVVDLVDQNRSTEYSLHDLMTLYNALQLVYGECWNSNIEKLLDMDPDTYELEDNHEQEA